MKGRGFGNFLLVAFGLILTVLMTFTVWCYFGKPEAYVLGFNYDPASPPQLRGKTAPRLLGDDGHFIWKLRGGVVTSASPYIDFAANAHGRPTMFYASSPNWTIGKKTFLRCQFQAPYDPSQRVAH